MWNYTIFGFPYLSPQLPGVPQVEDCGCIWLDAPGSSKMQLIKSCQEHFGAWPPSIARRAMKRLVYV